MIKYTSNQQVNDLLESIIQGVMRIVEAEKLDQTDMDDLIKGLRDCDMELWAILDYIESPEYSEMRKGD